MIGFVANRYICLIPIQIGSYWYNTLISVINRYWYWLQNLYQTDTDIPLSNTYRYLYSLSVSVILVILISAELYSLSTYSKVCFIFTSIVRDQLFLIPIHIGLYRYNTCILVRYRYSIVQHIYWYRYSSSVSVSVILVILISVELYTLSTYSKVFFIHKRCKGSTPPAKNLHTNPPRSKGLWMKIIFFQEKFSNLS